MKEYEQIRCGSLYSNVVIRSLLVKAAKTFGSLYIGGSWPAESLQFGGTWVPLPSVLCDDGYELSSFLNQATQGQ